MSVPCITSVLPRLGRRQEFGRSGCKRRSSWTESWPETGGGREIAYKERQQALTFTAVAAARGAGLQQVAQPLHVYICL